MEWISRDQWGARKRRSGQPIPAEENRGMAVHYSASAADTVDSHDDCAGRVRAIQNYHMDSRRWADIAYNWLTCQHEAAFEGRGWGVRSAANGTDAANDHYQAVCFLGADREDRDDVQPGGRRALAAVISEARRRFPHAWEVRPHSDFRNTGCPGNELRAWVGADMPIQPSGERPADMPTDAIVVRSKPVAIHGCATGGYWVACEDGGVFNFGGAPFLGSLGALALNAPITDLVGTKSGEGYWMAGADGGLFAFGDARADFGSLAHLQLAAPVVDLAASAEDDGAWMLGGDGGVFGLADAPFGGRIFYQPG